MIYIAHRGNVSGSDRTCENSPDYLRSALYKGYHVECDIRTYNGKLYLGHDEPKYPCEMELLQSWGVWIHCKDVESLRTMTQTNHVNYFFHEKDPFTITSMRYIWCYPCNFVEDGILVHPELLPIDLDISKAIGLCSDNVERWANGIHSRQR